MSFITLLSIPTVNANKQSSNQHSKLARIRTIAWSPNGHLIATGAADRTLRIWNPEKPQVKNSTDLKGHGGGIERVAWNPTKEAELASVSSDGTCRFWDVRNKACTAVVQLGGEGLTIAWAADGSVVMVGRKVIYQFPRLQPLTVPFQRSITLRLTSCS